MLPPSAELGGSRLSQTFRIRVNGRTREVSAEPETPLLWVLREQLKLTGTKFGCGVAMCGACTVLVDGKPRRPAPSRLQAVGEGKITTIEGLSPDRSHPVQKSLAGRTGPAMRLLPVGHDPLRRGLAGREAVAHRRRH